MSNLYVILGNGFSIDLIHKMNKETEINLSNLFLKGEKTKYPKTEINGFLSRKYCPNLWMLGARTTMGYEKSIELINDILTCANVYNLAAISRKDIQREWNVYTRAYIELTAYLRYLFIYYNSLISDDDLTNIMDKIPVLNLIKKTVVEGNKITIVTYNYDIFLERILTLAGLEYDICGFQDTGKLIQIFKPHGSISFSFKIKISETSPFTIRESFDDISQEAENFEIKYDLVNDYPIVNAIIPPAGDANRMQSAWIQKVRSGVIEKIKEAKSEDELIIFGVSYWHVDRKEIDDILINLNSNIELKYINPNPPTSFDAVLSSLFKNYVHYSSGEALRR